MVSRRVRDADADGDALDNTADVETPECIRFTHHVAGPVRRGLAYLVDVFLRGLVLLLTGLLVVGAGSIGVGPKASDRATTPAHIQAIVQASWGLWLMILFLVEWGWNVLFETFWGGRTIGKRLLRLRVVREGGYPVGFIDSVLRNLIRAADFLPAGYVLGLIVMSGDRRFRRLGDRIAGTVVVIEARATVSESIVLSPPATTTELEALPPHPALRREEHEAIDLFLRRGGLSAERRRELAEMIAPALAGRLGVTQHDPVRFLGLLHERAFGRHPPEQRTAP